MPHRSVPVTRLRSCVVIGPAGEPGDRHRELVRRAHAWQSVLSSTDRGLAHITALAQKALPDLRRSPGSGQAVIVQRALPVVTRLSLVGPLRPVWSGVRGLTDVASFTQSHGPRALAEAASLFRPWSGLLAPAGTFREGTFRERENRFGTRLVVCAGPGSLSVTRWAPSAAESAALAALHGLRLLAVNPYTNRGPRPADAVPAAGLSEEHWLLDGALSLLSRSHSAPRDVPAGAWSVNEQVSGLTAAALSQLAADVVAYLGHRRLRILGVRVLADPLLGEQSLAWGPVWIG